MPATPVNVMAQFHPDNFCDPASAKYRDKYAEIDPLHANQQTGLASLAASVLTYAGAYLGWSDAADLSGRDDPIGREYVRRL